MKRFECPRCARRVFFEDVTCLHCGLELTYDLFQDVIIPSADPCPNRSAWDCNWVAAPGNTLCPACSIDARVSTPGPDLTVFQSAKRRVLRQLRLLGVDPDAEPMLRFAMLRGTEAEPVTIGHADGLITLDVSEGLPARLERVRARLGEPYRTPLGHVRHESGHWHWQAYVTPDQDLLTRFRDLFGDERADYQASLHEHYDSVDDGAWRDTYLSHYATAHPWEDYAESFAHVLHMWAMVETAGAEGFIVDSAASLDEVYALWAPLTVGLNEMARSMGTPDPYPFAPPERALRKMTFVHEVIVAGSRSSVA